MRRIAVLTSGGDAPGMNAAIRAVVRMGHAHGWDVFGVQSGFAGLIAATFVPLSIREVGGIIQQGGTILGSARCPEFRSEDGQQLAVDHLKKRGIDGVIVIGGDGSQAGAYALSKLGIQVIGVASTIDNDLIGSNPTIGVDTALNIALEAIDRLRVTAASHKRAFLVETMGRHCGYIALMAGIAGGAEVTVVPEIETTPAAVLNELMAARRRGKSHGLVVVAEGAKYDADDIAAYAKENADPGSFDLRVTKLGHVQRGGAPTASDRLLATRLAAHAVERMANGETAIVVGLQNEEVGATPHIDIVGKQKPLDPDILELAQVLAL